MSKQKVVNVRMDEGTLANLKQLADKLGLSMSAVIRLLVNEGISK